MLINSIKKIEPKLAIEYCKECISRNSQEQYNEPYYMILQNIAEENKNYPELAILKLLLLVKGYGNYEDFDFIKENVEDVTLLNDFTQKFIKSYSRNNYYIENDDIKFFFRLLKENNQYHEILKKIDYKVNAIALLDIVDYMFVRGKNELLKKLMDRFASILRYNTISNDQYEIKLLEWIGNNYTKSELEIYKNNRFFSSDFILDLLHLK
jgi:hypothetical protein